MGSTVEGSVPGSPRRLPCTEGWSELRCSATIGSATHLEVAEMLKENTISYVDEGKRARRHTRSRARSSSFSGTQCSSGVNDKMISAVCAHKGVSQNLKRDVKEAGGEKTHLPRPLQVTTPRLRPSLARPRLLLLKPPPGYGSLRLSLQVERDVEVSLDDSSLVVVGLSMADDGDSRGDGHGGRRMVRRGR